MITWRLLFSSAMASFSSVCIRTISAFNLSSSLILAISADSRALILATSRRWRSSFSASWRSNSRIASRASTSCSFKVFSSSRLMKLAFTFCAAVSSVIFLIPSASRILSIFRYSLGVCSR